MHEDELGAMFKRLASMTEDRCSDYAVGKAAMEFVEAAMNHVIEKQMAGAGKEATFGRPLSAAELMDLESGIAG